MYRRGFLRSLAAAPAAALAPQAPSPSPSLPPSEARVAELLTEVVRARYGAPLDAAALDEIKKGIEGSLQTAARLRRLKLGNPDEPVTLFEARPRPARRRP